MTTNQQPATIPKKAVRFMDANIADDSSVNDPYQSRPWISAASSYGSGATTVSSLWYTRQEIRSCQRECQAIIKHFNELKNMPHFDELELYGLADVQTTRCRSSQRQLLRRIILDHQGKKTHSQRSNWDAHDLAKLSRSYSTAHQLEAIRRGGGSKEHILLAQLFHRQTQV